jgi:DNA polymerase III epsilon subunit-like protein
MPRNLVLFDLEWNIGYQPYTFNYHGVQQTLRGEIVEIGAVKIDEDANVLDTFCAPASSANCSTISPR